MGWRDRVRRPRPSTVENVGSAGSGPLERAPAGVGVPEGWDGGWRAASSPELTLARAPLAVSDGLAFRAGLAAWRDPSFDTGLAHGVLPSAPAGLVRGVARTASGSGETFSGGGPLLLRAVRREDPEEVAPAGGERLERVVTGRPRQAERPAARGTAGSGSAPEGGAEAGRVGMPAVQRRRASSGQGPVSRDVPGAPAAPVEEQRGLTPTSSPAVLGTPEPTVQRAATAAAPTRALPVVRRVAAVDPRTGGAVPAPRPTPARTATVPRADSAPASSGTGGGRTAPVTPATTSAPVRPLPVGRSLIVARRPAGPTRRVTPVPTAAPKVTATPAPQTERQPEAARPKEATVQRHEGSRPPLGAPMSQLPPTAVPMKQGPVEGGTPGPTLPVVQSRPEATSERSSTPGGTPTTPSTEPARRRAAEPTAPRTRTGLGAPLSALPATADVPGNRQRSGRNPVQRSAAPAPGAPQQPSQTSLLGTTQPDVTGTPVGRTPSDAPTPTSPPGALVQRRTSPDSAPTGDPAHSAPLTVARTGTPASEAPRTAPQDAPARRSPAPGDTGRTAQRAPAPPAASRTPERPTLGSPDRQTPVSPAPGRPAPGTAQGESPLPPVRPGTPARQASSTGQGQAPLTTARPGTPAHHAPGTAQGASPQTPARPGTPAHHTPGATQGSTPLTPARPGAPGATHTPAAPASGRPGTPTRRAPGASSQGSAPVRPGAPARQAPGGTPLVVARAVTVTGQAAPAAPSPTLNLLPARPLTLSTEAAPPIAAPAQRRAAERPVVAPRWTRETAGAPTSAAVQRAPQAPVAPAPARAVRSTPLAPAPTAPAARPLPVTAPQPPAVQPFLANAPAREATPPSPAPPLVRPVRIQRDADGTASPPAAGQVKAASPPPEQSRTATTSRAKTPAPESAPDLDDLARRLLDPVSRLLRSELRRGRDRTGRPFDGRR